MKNKATLATLVVALLLLGSQKSFSIFQLILRAKDPQGLRLVGVSSQSVSLDWHRGDELTKYFTVCYEEEIEPKESCWQAPNPRRIKTEESRLVLKNLKENTPYKFRVIAQFDDGLPSRGVTVTARTVGL